MGVPPNHLFSLRAAAENSCNICSYASFQWNNAMNSQRQSQGCDVSCGIHGYSYRFHAISFRTFLVLPTTHQFPFAKCAVRECFKESLAMIRGPIFHLLPSKAQVTTHTADATVAMSSSSFAGLMGEPQNPLVHHKKWTM